MPRVPRGPRYYNSRKAYYVKIRGEQKLLATGPKDEPDGPTYKKAIQEFARLMTATKRDEATDGMPVSKALVYYFFELEQSKRLPTLDVFRKLLEPFIADMGRIPLKDLKPFNVQEWLSKRDTWNDSTKGKCIGCLITALNWCKKQKYITINPLEKMTRPEENIRGTDFMIPEELGELLIGLAKPPLAKVLRVLKLTGARPGEILHAECKHYKPSAAVIVLPWNPPPGEWRWKNGKKTKKDRKIFLPSVAREIVEQEIAERQGKGPIFLTKTGLPWKGETFVRYMLYLAEKQPVRDWCERNGFDASKIMAYGFRHAYITRMLMAGCPIKILADLCGTSVSMIERVYGHGLDDELAMRRFVLQFHSAAFADGAATNPIPSSHDAAQSDPAPPGNKT